MVLGLRYGERGLSLEAAGKPSSSTDDDGFLAVDAVTGLTILAVSLSLALVAGHTAMRLGARANEIEQARGTLSQLLDRSPLAIGAQSGTVSGQSWSLNVTPDVDLKGFCRAKAEVDLARARTAYRAVSLRRCSMAKPA